MSSKRGKHRIYTIGSIDEACGRLGRRSLAVEQPHVGPPLSDRDGLRGGDMSIDSWSGWGPVIVGRYSVRIMTAPHLFYLA